MKNIILAEKAGFCFGVKRGVDLSLNSVNKYNKKVYTLGPLIHNNNAVEYLKENNIYPIEFEELITLQKDDVVIIRSHGVTPKVLEKLENLGVITVDATCPYVSNIHKKVKEYYDLGYKIVIVGDSQHPEVIGINGWCNDEAIISKDGCNIDILPPKVCVVAQTTEKKENWDKVLEKVSSLSEDIVSFNTICNATEVRQKAAYDLSKQCDAVIVLGGKHSSNTTKLFEICKENCINTVHVENAGQIPDYILNENKITNIGVTAGASTPDWIIKEAILKMNHDENLEMNEQLMFMEQNETALHVGKEIKGEVVSLNQKEVFINLNYKADGVLPIHEISSEDNINLKDLFQVGQIITAKIINMKNDDGNVVLSTLVIEREANFEKLKESFENKTPISVKVKEVIKGGVLGSFKGIRVFIPASQLDVFRVNNIEEYVGKDLEVVLIEYSREKRNTKIVASRKVILEAEKSAAAEETWSTIQKGETVEGIVRRIAGFGAFVNVNGIDGLLHISELSWGKVNKIENMLSVGDKIKVYILDADKENKKLSLSIKALTSNPWTNVEEKYPVENVVLGKVVRFTDFGAFIELEPGVDGLVHISQISHRRIEKPSQALTLGESVKAKILEVNSENKRIALSIKELEEI